METTAHSKSSSWPFVVGGIVLILIFLVAVKVLALSSPAPDDDAARIAERTKAHEDLLAENKVKLETYAWADKAKGHVQIPIKQAMEMIVAASAGHTPAAAGPIVVPAAAAAPAAAPAATPKPANP